MNEKAKIYALRTFQNKAKTDRFFTVECISATKQVTQSFTGFNQITVFITEEQYNKLLSSFELMKEIVLNVTLQGNRVSYSLAA